MDATYKSIADLSFKLRSVREENSRHSQVGTGEGLHQGRGYITGGVTFRGEVTPRGYTRRRGYPGEGLHQGGKTPGRENIR